LAASKINLGLQKSLKLGNLGAKRDWGYAPEFCEGMWRMLQQKEPDDFVLATGETHTVREFADVAFRELDMELEWKGKGAREQGILKKTGKVVVGIDPNYYRPTEVELLIGDATKAKKKLGWSAKTKFTDLVKMMVKADFEKVKKRGY
jgi:GDPmannose 4,6-dehydratase